MLTVLLPPAEAFAGMSSAIPATTAPIPRSKGNIEALGTSPCADVLRLVPGRASAWLGRGIGPGAPPGGGSFGPAMRLVILPGHGSDQTHHKLAPVPSICKISEQHGLRYRFALEPISARESAQTLTQAGPHQ